MPVYYKCWTPSGGWRDPMKLNLSVLPSCRLSGCFVGMGSLDFFEFRHGARASYEVVCDRAGIFRKTFFAAKIGEMGQK